MNGRQNVAGRPRPPKKPYVDRIDGRGSFADFGTGARAGRGRWDEQYRSIKGLRAVAALIMVMRLITQGWETVASPGTAGPAVFFLPRICEDTGAVLPVVALQLLGKFEFATLPRKNRR
jgi:hypothetical protein